MDHQRIDQEESGSVTLFDWVMIGLVPVIAVLDLMDGRIGISGYTMIIVWCAFVTAKLFPHFGSGAPEEN
jgi:hypothetical protein